MPMQQKTARVKPSTRLMPQLAGVQVAFGVWLRAERMKVRVERESACLLNTAVCVLGRATLALYSSRCDEFARKNPYEQLAHICSSAFMALRGTPRAHTAGRVTTKFTNSHAGGRWASLDYTRPRVYLAHKLDDGFSHALKGKSFEHKT